MKKTSIVFTGDIGFDRYMSGKWNDPDLISREILDFLRAADHVCVNVEGPVIGARENTENSGAAQLLQVFHNAASFLRYYYETFY